MFQQLQVRPPAAMLMIAKVHQQDGLDDVASRDSA